MEALKPAVEGRASARVQRINESMNSDALDLLRQVHLFSRLDEESLQSLAARVRRRHFPAGEALFHEGDAGNTLYVIISGCVSIQRMTGTGEVFYIAERGKGEPFGEMALIDGKPRMADAVTAEPCVLLMLEQSDFHDCLARNPPMAISVMACLADRLREAADYLEWWRSLDVLGRLSAALLDLKSRHGVEGTDEGLLLKCQVNQQDVADRIMASRESVNRAFGRLKKSSLVRVEGKRVWILDEDKLRRYSS